MTIFLALHQTTNTSRAIFNSRPNRWFSPLELLISPLFLFALAHGFMEMETNL